MALAGEVARLKSDPAPLNPTLCVLPAALSLTVTVPLRIPDVVGANATLIVHVAPAATVGGQLFVWA